MSDVSLIDADGTVRFQGTMTGGGGSQTVYVQPTDPGAVGAGVLWIDTSGVMGEAVFLKIRNLDDSGWGNPWAIDAASLTAFSGAVVRLTSNATSFTAAVDAGANMSMQSSRLRYENDDGDEIFNAYATGRFELDPQNGQVDVLGGALGGFLRLAATSEPADARLFNGSFIFYKDGNDLKAKANIGGSFLHLTVGTFA